MPKGRVLAIAASDSGGGAGIQADIKTITMLGGYAGTAITAITVQNTLGVFAVRALPADLVAAQARAFLSDIGADAIKTGALGGQAIVERVAEIADGAPDATLIVDPVMAAKGGRRLFSKRGWAALRRLLVPRAGLLTPNAVEAEALCGREVGDLDQLRAAGETLLRMGARAVLLKGGHLSGPSSVDILLTPNFEKRFESPRVASSNTHGTGCTLASACATGLALGLELPEAVEGAWRYTAEAIRRAPGLGAGPGPLDHGWPLRGP